MLRGGRLRAVAGDLDQSRGTLLAGHDLHSVLVQVRPKLGELLLGQLDLFQGGRDLAEAEVAPLSPLGHQRAHLVDLEDRNVGRTLQQRHSALLCQPVAPLRSQ